MLIAINCEWGNWIPTGSCSKSCGGGNQRYSRKKLVVEDLGGNCTGQALKVEKCNIKECPGNSNSLRYAINILK